MQMWYKKEKEKCKCLKTSTCTLLGTLMTICFNQFMEDLGRIYQLRKYFPSFDDDVCQSSIPSSDDSGL